MTQRGGQAGAAAERVSSWSASGRLLFESPFSIDNSSAQLCIFFELDVAFAVRTRDDHHVPVGIADPHFSVICIWIDVWLLDELDM